MRAGLGYGIITPKLYADQTVARCHADAVFPSNQLNEGLP
jgi:hypothetical protein